MDNTSSKKTRWVAWAAVCMLPVLMMATGCQIDVSGQTLPSPYYLSDDVQYYAPGPGFKLAREAAAMKQQSEAEPAMPPPAAQP